MSHNLEAMLVGPFFLIPLIFNLFISLFDKKSAAVCAIICLAILATIDLVFIYPPYRAGRGSDSDFLIVIFAPPAGVILGFIVGKFARNLFNKTDQKER